MRKSERRLSTNRTAVSAGPALRQSWWFAKMPRHAPASEPESATIQNLARHPLNVSKYDVAPREGTSRVRRKILRRLLKRFISRPDDFPSRRSVCPYHER